MRMSLVFYFLSLGFFGCGGAEAPKVNHKDPKADELAKSGADSLIYALPQSQSASDVVATFGQEKITLAELDAQASAEINAAIRKLSMDIFEVRQNALTTLIQIKMMKTETAEKNYANQEELFQKDILANVSKPTDEEKKAFFDENSELMGEQPYEALADRIGQHLFRERLEEASQRYISTLEAKYKVSIGLEPFREVMGSEGASKGPENAPITIVEYADFQCPYCVVTAKAVDEVFAAYPDKVRVVFRHFPLSFHEFAMAAAVATRCADREGKFWAMHDKMFALSDDLNDEKILESATSMGLKLDAFKACIADPTQTSAVEKEMERGSELGVEGTPAVFLNGIPLKGAQSSEELKAIVERELKRLKR